MILRASRIAHRKLKIPLVAENINHSVIVASILSQKGAKQGIPATGKTVNQPSISVFHLPNGKIAEGWLVTDDLSMMQQLGVIPAAPAASES